MSCPHCACPNGASYSSTEVICDACGRSSAAALWKGKPRKRRRYEEGSHGAKGREKKRVKTSGKTHQSEHVVGYEVFGQGAKRGKSEFAKMIENQAPAYQEELDSHRGHIGTGNWKDYRGTGESSDQYRRAQRRAVRDRRVGNAVQLNQLYYSFQPEFRTSLLGKRKQLDRADDSFRHMVDNFQPVPLWDGTQLTRVPVTELEKAEMNLARMTASSGKFPSRSEEIKKMQALGIIVGEMEKKPKQGPLALTRDIHDIPKDGNCLFHSIWAALHALMPGQVGFTTNLDLRRQAVGFLRHDPDIAALNVVGPEYLQAMEQNGTWGGELEAMALAHIWGIQITVNAPNYTITYNQTAARGIDIYYDGIGHYSVGPL